MLLLRKIQDIGRGAVRVTGGAASKVSTKTRTVAKTTGIGLTGYGLSEIVDDVKRSFNIPDGENGGIGGMVLVAVGVVLVILLIKE